MNVLLLGSEKQGALLAQLAALTVLTQGNAELSEKVEAINQAVNEGNVSIDDNSSAHFVIFDSETWESDIKTIIPVKPGNGNEADGILDTHQALERANMIWLHENLNARVSSQLEIGCLYWRRAKGGVSYWIIDSVKDGKVFAWYSNKDGKKLKEAPVEFPDVRSLQKAKHQAVAVA
ncbi:MAG: hypothetical protein ACTS9Y_00275 [Methylophilus sp.]|uniref:hypothetical protein n=1 Tax=Methylophilus sp. TaxID=29541 RepID=UPI003F9F41D4